MPAFPSTVPSWGRDGHSASQSSHVRSGDPAEAPAWWDSWLEAKGSKPQALLVKGWNGFSPQLVFAFQSPPPHPLRPTPPSSGAGLKTALQTAGPAPETAQGAFSVSELGVIQPEKSSRVTGQQPRRNLVPCLVGQDDIAESGRSRPILGLCLHSCPR